MSEKPSSSPAAGTHTPGWNDPPSNLPYNPLSSNPSAKPRINLNKRVAFPLTQSPPSKPTAIVQPSQTMTSAPPISSSPLTSHQPIAVVHPMPAVNFPSSVSFSQSSDPLPENAKDFVISTFRENLALVQNSTSIHREDIERRITMLEECWRTESLAQTIQWKLFRISKAISENNPNEAMQLYTSLVISFPNSSTWAIGIRHIILALQAQQNINAPLNSRSANTNQDNINPSATITNRVLVPAMPRASSVEESSNVPNDGTSANSSLHI